MAEKVSVRKIAFDGLKFGRRNIRERWESVTYTRLMASRKFFDLLHKYGTVEEALIADEELGGAFVENVSRATKAARSRGREIEIE